MLKTDRKDMRRFWVILLLVGALVGSAGCFANPAAEPAVDEGATEEDPPSENRTAADTNESETTNESNSNFDWETKLDYDYVRDPVSEGNADADIPEKISELTAIVTFLHWPPASPAPGICSSDGDLVIEIENPQGTTVLRHDFNGTLETGEGSQSCAPSTSFSQQNPAPGQWHVSFRGQGVAVGEVVFSNG
jgi:hypothetical protein